MEQPSEWENRRRLERLDRQDLETTQVLKFNDLLRRILPDNRFYATKLADCPQSIRTLDELREFPCTTKAELLPGSPGHSPFAGNRTYPVDQYQYLHRTSGTHGHPLLVLDTADDWQWWIATWQYVLDSAAVTGEDRAMMAFSFGPFIGFWSANDALRARGAMVIPGGGLSSVARLELLLASAATLVCCTPSYALHLAEVAQAHQLPIDGSAVRALIVAGEPGGNLPVFANRIARAWNAEVIDHAGATEVGPWSYADRQRTGLHIIESEFIAEFLRPGSLEPASDGEVAEIVLTSLGRFGAPVIRYRTGDLARPCRAGRDGIRFVFLEGGVLGRVDDMTTIRGVNLYPSSVEHALGDFPDIAEYRLAASRRGSLDHLTLEVEAPADQAPRIAEHLRSRLGLNIEVTAVASGTLPRFEHKGKRFVDHRS
jgi:phenylacetate-CoA ligase